MAAAIKRNWPQNPPSIVQNWLRAAGVVGGGWDWTGCVLLGEHLLPRVRQARGGCWCQTAPYKRCRPLSFFKQLKAAVWYRNAACARSAIPASRRHNDALCIYALLLTDGGTHSSSELSSLLG